METEKCAAEKIKIGNEDCNFFSVWPFYGLIIADNRRNFNTF